MARRALAGSFSEARLRPLRRWPWLVSWRHIRLSSTSARVLYVRWLGCSCRSIH